MLANLDVVGDLRIASRVLRREWRAAASAVTCIAIGIGASTAMFAAGDALLLRPFPFPNGDRLYVASTATSDSREPTGTSYEDFLDWRQRQRSFAELAAYGTTPVPVVLDRPVTATAVLATANVFRVVGVTPMSGRAFVDGEDQPNAEPVAVVKRGFAERELGGVEAATGRVIDVRGIPRTIVGVVPDEQVLPPSGEIWLPVPRDLNAGRGNGNLEVIGLLRSGVSAGQAEKDLAAIETDLSATYPRDGEKLTAIVFSLRSRMVAPARQPLTIMMAAAILMLLVACANVAGIQLARANARTREIAVRSAIGATRWRLVRQLLVESVLLSCAGGLAGIVLASQASGLAINAVYGPTPSWLAPALDWRIVAFVAAVSILNGIAFGIVPALRLARTDASDVLRGRSGVTRKRARLQHAHVIAQLAASIVLVVAAGLSMQSIAKLHGLPLGFNPDGVLTFSISTQSNRYDDAPAERARLLSAVATQAAALPGVAAAGGASSLPLRCCMRWRIHVEGREPSEVLTVSGQSVTPDYFLAMEIPVKLGRAFAATDGAASAPVIMVNETFAARFWPDGNVIGRVVQDGSDRATVIGVVSDVKQGSNLADATEAQFYRPFAQRPVTVFSVAVRTRGDPLTLVAPLRTIVRDLDPTLPIYGVSTMRKRVDNAMLQGSALKTLLLTLSGVALLLACLGVFAVGSFFVASRMRELSVRIALGAEPRSLIALVLKQTGLVALIGGIIGLAGSVGAGRWLASSLYGIRAFDPLVLTIASLILTAATIVASYAPARRAALADPMLAMRSD